MPGRVVGPPRDVGAFDRRVQYPETVRVVVELPRDVYLAAGAAADAASADGDERFARDDAIRAVRGSRRAARCGRTRARTLRRSSPASSSRSRVHRRRSRRSRSGPAVNLPTETRAAVPASAPFSGTPPFGGYSKTAAPGAESQREGTRRDARSPGYRSNAGGCVFSSAPRDGGPSQAVYGALVRARRPGRARMRIARNRARRRPHRAGPPFARAGASRRPRHAAGSRSTSPTLVASLDFRPELERSLSRAPKLAYAGSGETFANRRADGASPLSLYVKVPVFTLVRWKISSITR